MSQLQIAGFALCLPLVLAAGCSSVTGHPGTSPEADRIAVYEGVPRDPREYRLVKRVWAGSWTSAFMVPSYGSIEEGASAMQNQAVNSGGDAIMNFGCYRRDANIPMESRPSLVCNGNVIQYVQ